jgi:outer membrane lipoprotein SlyB
MKTVTIGVSLVCGVLFAGCTFPSSTRMVTRQQAGQMRKLDYGTVEKINAVTLEGQRGPIGLYGGGAAGVAGGGAIGQGVGTDLAKVGGGIVGAVTGQAVEEVVTRKAAQEMIIKLDNGTMVVVTQAGPEVFAVGERVAVANGPGGAQVLHP